MRYGCQAGIGAKTSRAVWRIAAAGLLCVGFHAGSALADYPEKPIHYVIPFPPGGSTDFTGRTLATGLAKEFDQPVVVENRPGAGGNVGAGYVGRANPDGYTILQGTIGTHGFNPTLFKNITYDARNDFVPIARMTSGTNVLVVNPNVPARTVEELIAYAKENPGKLTMGSSGPGSSIHMSGELFQLLTGTEFTHIPFRGGGPAMTALIAGHVDLMFDNIPVSLPHIKAGNVRPLAVTSKGRSPILPDVPSMQEAGVDDYEMTSWSIVFAPADTPDDVVKKLNTTINKVLSSDEVTELFNANGVGVHLMGVEEVRDFVDTEITKWGNLVKEANIQLQ